MNIAKFLKTPISKNICEQLFLYFMVSGKYLGPCQTSMMKLPNKKVVKIIIKDGL